MSRQGRAGSTPAWCTQHPPASVVELRQTRQVQALVPFGACGFDSRPTHHPLGASASSAWLPGMAEQPTPGVYRHFKGGDYLVLGAGGDAADDARDLVAYVDLSARPGPKFWVRDVDDFTSAAPDGSGPRFRYLGPVLPDD